MRDPIASDTSGPVPDTELLRILQRRGSVRDYKPDPIPESWIAALLAAGQRAPTSSNIQACSIIMVREQAKKMRLAELAGNQKHIVDCPVFIALCADLTRTAHACLMHQEAFQGQTLEIGLVASVDAALVGMAISLAAESLGLGSVMIGAMRNQPLEVAKLLELPPRCYVVFGMCLGFPASAPLPKPRLPWSAFVHQERYDESTREAALREYDMELGRYYRGQGRPTLEQSWTRAIATAFSVARRKHLRQELQTLGFELE